MSTVNGIPFRQWLVPSSKYNIKAPYTMIPKKITLHNTDNEMPAENEISYMRNNNNQVSYHVAIDEKEAIQGLPYNRNGWHSGDGGNGYGNRNTIGVEICRNYDRSRKTTKLNDPLKSQYTKAEQNTIKFVAQLCIDLGIVANNANIKTHNDWNGKWCPSKILNEGRLQQVKNAIIVEYNRLTGKKDVPPATSTADKKADGHLSFSQVVDKTIAGGYGVYPQREKNINVKTNFTYKTVQDELNKRFGATTSKPKANPAPKRKSISEVAEEVRKGKWGNNPKRKENLIKAGYDYAAIQREVNRLEGLKVPSKPARRSVSVGDTVTTKSLYTTGHSTQNVRSSSIKGYVDRIDNNWRNPIRLRNKKGGYYLGFTRQSDVL